MDGIRHWMSDVPGSEWSAWDVTMGARWMTVELAGICGILVGAIMAIGLAFGFAQVGFVVSFKSLALNWDWLIPENPMGKMISMESGIKGFLNAMKVTLLLHLLRCCWLWMRRGQLSIRNFTSIDAVAAFGWRLGLIICMAMAVLQLAWLWRTTCSNGSVRNKNSR